MLAGSGLFAIMSAFAHALGERCDWPWVALVRSILVWLLALGLAWSAGVRLVWLRPLTLWWRSLAGSLSMLCTFYALTHLPISDVLTLTNTFPLWVAVLSWPLLGEVPHPRVWVAVAFGLLGIVILEEPRLLAGNWATLMAVLASVFTAIAMLGLNRLQALDPRAVVVHFSAVATLFGGLAIGLFETRAVGDNDWGWVTLWLLLGVGVTATVGQVFLTKAFAAGAPAEVAVVGLSQVVFAWLIDVWWWQRPLTSSAVVGTGLILAPTAWLLLSKRASRTRSTVPLATAPATAPPLAEAEHDSRS
jgi:drug/metabolite transporter (DMT)-like permease